MKTFSFDKNQASKQDAPRSISQNGAYIGKIIQAEMYQTDSGAQMFEFIFNANGSNCLISMCVCDKTGKDTFQVGYLHALMGLLNIKTLNTVYGKAKNFKDNTEYETYRIPSIENRPIGVLLEKEIDCYTNKQGETKEIWNMRVVSFFDANTKKTFHEITEGKEAKSIEARLKVLKDRQTKRYIEWKQRSSGSNYNNGYQAQDNFPDEEIPF